MRLAAFLLLPACLLGEDPFKGESNRPQLQREPELITPEPTGEGPVPVRAGTEVVVRLHSVAALDLDATALSLGGDALDCDAEGPTTLLCRRTYDGSEVPTAKGVRGDLVNPAGNRTSLNTPPLIVADFTAPDATCLLSPRVAQARDEVSLVLTLSKPIDESTLQVTPSDSRITVVPQDPIGLQLPFAIVGEPGENIEDYELTITAADLAGNPQDGASLCAPASRTGTILGRGPALTAPVQIQATESVVASGTTWVRSGSEIRVTFLTQDPIDPVATRVALSGLALEHLQDQTWGIDLQGTEGDGFRDLDASLVDAAGNTLRHTESNTLRFDFTPPSADCVLSPLFANAEQTIFFDVFASEPLPSPPSVTSSDPRLTVQHVSTTNTQHRYQLVPEAGQNIDYTLSVTATDRAGNPQLDASMCDPANRTGEVRGVLPQVDGDITLVAEPHVLVADVPTVRAGATVTVHIPTQSSISGAASRVDLSGLELTYVGNNTWTHTLTGSEGEGLKSLDARLVDNTGNTQREQRAGVLRFDFSPPSAACLLSPSPANLTQAQAGLTFELRANEPLGTAPGLSASDARVTVGVPTQPSSLVWRFPLSIDGLPASFSFTLDATAADLLGNEAQGDDLCPAADRTGQIDATPPSASDVQLTVTGDRVHQPASGEPIAGLGATLTVSLSSTSDIDTAATQVQLGDIILTHASDLTWTHTVSQNDLDGLKPLAVTLVSPAGNRAQIPTNGLAVRVDLTPPTASCQLSPSQANSSQLDAIQLTVQPSEPLGEPPSLSLSAPGILHATPLFQAPRWAFAMSASGVTSNLDYTATVTLTDRVGNTATGAEVCPEADRTGQLRPVTPIVVTTPSLSFEGPAPYIHNGTPWLREGASVHVNISVAPEYDPTASSVTLSGTPLSWDATASHWTTGPLSGSEGDGLKTLEIHLTDAYGNSRSHSFPGTVGFDFTRPSASCVLSPVEANGADVPRLQLFADEPLAGPPSLTIFGDVTATLTDVSSDARSFTWEVSAIATGNDLDYGLQIQGADRVGNPQRGTSFCAPADRNGTIDNQPPEAEATFAVTPAVQPVGEAQRAAHGASIEVTLRADEPLGIVGTAVSLGDVALDISTLNAPEGTTPERWVTTLHGTLDDSTHTEGLKQLVALFRDERGNPGPAITTADLPNARVVADFTAPDVVSVLLQRQPFFAPADDGSGTIFFTETDPVTGAAVRAALTVFTNEVLSGSAVLHNAGPQSLPFAPSSVAGTRADFHLDTISGIAEGSYTFEIDLTDHVGNTARRTLNPTTLVVDRTGPASPPSVDDAGTVTLDRAPWGTSSTGSSPAFSLTGTPGAASPGVLLTAESAVGARLASGFSAGDGGFALTLGTDQADVWLRQHDLAGNPSPPGRVRDVRWTATLAGKVLGSDLENPHRLDAAPLLAATFATPRIEADSLPLTTVSAPTWTRWQAPEPAPAPPPRTGHTMAFNPVTGDLLMFGGLSPDGTPLADTWAWDGERWEEVTPPAGSGDPPSGRFQHAMAFDPASGRVLLQGGCVNPGSFGQCAQINGETWAWDGTRWLQSTITPNPGSRDRHAMVFDGARQRIVLFGGRGNNTSCGSSNACSDTWEWDGSTWERRELYSPPARRHGHQLAYDAERGRVVLFGGLASISGSCGDPSSTRCRDTWLWDGHSWVDATDDPATGPSPRTAHTMTYDPTRTAVVLVGGVGPQAGLCGTDSISCADAWAWSGTAWTPLDPPAGVFPRTGQGMAYDPSRGQLLIFGGEAPAPEDCAPTSSPMCNDTWAGDGSAWTEVPTLGADEVTPPPGLRDLAMAYDASRGRIVLFGGRDPSGPQNRTWEWDGSLWRDVSPDPATPANTPAARTEHALVYDAARQEVLLFGGLGSGGSCHPTTGSNRCADTWVWDGASWTELTATASTPTNTPPGRYGHRLAYDATHDTVVLFGGLGASNGACGTPSTICRDTWEWNGSTWIERTPTPITHTNSPSGRFAHGMTGHPEAGHVVLFGGTTGGLNRESDTWVWSGTDWNLQAPSASPSARRGHAMSYDPARQRVVLFGGAATSTSTRFNDTWEWDGATWRVRATDTVPPGRIDHALAPFPQQAEMLVFGGQTNLAGACEIAGSTLCRDTWRLPSGSDASPAHLFSPSFLAARAPEAQLRAVSARWMAGGRATPEGSETPGAELILWTGDRWTPIDAHSADPDAPAALCVNLLAHPDAPAEPGCAHLVDPVLVQGLFRFGARRASTFGVRPVEPIGFDEGVIHTAEVVVTVHYRLPPD